MTEPRNLRLRNTSDVYQCRICLSDEPAANRKKKLIVPCRCDGSSRYVHRKCLQKWMDGGHARNTATHCSVCKYEYQRNLHIVYNDAGMRESREVRIRQCVNACFPKLLGLITILIFAVGWCGLLTWKAECNKCATAESIVANAAANVTANATANATTNPTVVACDLRICPIPPRMNLILIFFGMPDQFFYRGLLFFVGGIGALFLMCMESCFRMFGNSFLIGNMYFQLPTSENYYAGIMSFGMGGYIIAFTLIQECHFEMQRFGLWEIDKYYEVVDLGADEGEDAGV